MDKPLALTSAPFTSETNEAPAPHAMPTRSVGAGEAAGWSNVIDGEIDTGSVVDHIDTASGRYASRADDALDATPRIISEGPRWSVPASAFFEAWASTYRQPAETFAAPKARLESLADGKANHLILLFVLLSLAHAGAASRNVHNYFPQENARV